MDKEQFLMSAERMLEKNEERLRRKTINKGRFTLRQIFDRKAWDAIPKGERSERGVWFCAAVRNGRYPQIKEANDVNAHWHTLYEFVEKRDDK